MNEKERFKEMLQKELSGGKKRMKLKIYLSEDPLVFNLSTSPGQYTCTFHCLTDPGKQADNWIWRAVFLFVDVLDPIVRSMGWERVTQELVQSNKKLLMLYQIPDETNSKEKVPNSR